MMKADIEREKKLVKKLIQKRSKNSLEKW
jgi:hypothetical protein